MVAAKSLGHEHLDRLSEHLATREAEHALRLRVDHFDGARWLIITMALGADSTTWRKRSSLFNSATATISLTSGVVADGTNGLSGLGMCACPGLGGRGSPREWQYDTPIGECDAPLAHPGASRASL